MNIVFAGGGTAGHINPALAIAGYIKRIDPDCKISFIGTEKGIENRLVKREGYDYYSINVSGFQRKLTVKNVLKNVSAVCKVFTSSVASKKILKKLNPDVVVGTGGYVCGPVLKEAAALGIKTAVHEANAYPGVTIKMLAPTVDVVMVAMEDALKNIKAKNPPVVTGNPIRQSLTSITKSEARKILGISDNEKVLLAFGGSLGARVINESMLEVIKWDMENRQFRIFHGTGKTGYDGMMSKLAEVGFDENNGFISVSEYIDNMDVILAAADVVVSRAGAMTVNELQVCGKPSILIPSPYVAENHQFHNAMSLKRVGAGEIIEEKDLTGEKLLETVRQIIFDDKKLEKMSAAALEIAIPDADRRITETVLNLVKNA